MKYLYLAFISIFFVACNKKEKQSTEDAILSDTSNKALTPLMAYDNEGQPYIWWVEKLKENNKCIVAFSSSKNKGDSFGKSITIPVTLGCNDGHGQGMPKLIFKKDGTLVIVYHRKQETENNQYAGKIYYSLSDDKGKTWSEPSILHQDTIADNSHGFPALTLLPDGEIGAVWLDGRNKLPHSELFMARTEKGKGFTNESKIGSPACQCCKIDFYTDPNNNIHVLYRGIADDNIRDITHIVSNDNGKTFSEASIISNDGWKIKGCPHAGPGMTEYKDSLHYVWFTMGGGEGIFYCTSDKNGSTFSKRVTLAQGVAKYPQIASSKNKLFITWQEFDTTNAENKYTRVKLRIDSTGKVINSYGSPEQAESSHPALLAIDDNNILLAYEKKVNDKTVVCYRKLNIE